MSTLFSIRLTPHVLDTGDFAPPTASIFWLRVFFLLPSKVPSATVPQPVGQVREREPLGGMGTYLKTQWTFWI